MDTGSSELMVPQRAASSIEKQISLPKLPQSPRCKVLRQSAAPLNRKQNDLLKIGTRSMTSFDMSGSKSVSDAGSTKSTKLPKNWLVQHDIQNPFKYTADEVIDILNGKLKNSFPGIRRLFESGGSGKILSRERLHSIFVSLMGYISKELFERVMRKLGLQHTSHVSLEMFTSKFSNNPSVYKEWYEPIEIQKRHEEESRYRELHLRYPAVHINEENMPASYYIAYLKKQVKNRNYQFESYLDEEILSGQRNMIRAELREFFLKLCSHKVIQENVMDLIWTRFDLMNTGHISINQFRSVIGQTDQQMATQPLLSNAEVMDFSNPTEKSLDLSSPAKPVFSNFRKPVKFESLVEEMNYNFEEPAESLLDALRSYDRINDGFVTKSQLRHTLSCFGFSIEALELETFISKNHLRVLNDLVEYRDLVHRFTLRDSHGMVSRIINDDRHYYNGKEFMRNLSKCLGKTAPIECDTAQLEAYLVAFLMGKYLAFIQKLRSLDSQKEYALPLRKFKPLIEELIKRKPSHTEWEDLIKLMGGDMNEPLQYELIIELLGKRKPIWNIKSILGHSVTVVPEIKQSEPIKEVKQKASDEKKMFKSTKGEMRSLNQISELIRELMKTRFMLLDYTYRQEDRKYTGRLDQDMLRKILNVCGLTLTVDELEKLWGTFALAKDGLYTWSKFCQRYIRDDNQLKQAGRSEEPTRTLNSAADSGRYSISGFRPAVSRQAKTSTLSDPILTKIVTKVQSNLAKIRDDFSYFDTDARGSVSFPQVEHIFKSYRMGLSEIETKHISNLFDLERSERFHYRVFLSTLTPRVPTNQNQRLRTRSTSPMKPNLRAQNHRVIRQLGSKMRELNRHFKRSDPLGQGRLSIRDFCDVLSLVGVKVSDEERIEIASLFDHKMKGEINYKEFANTLLANSAPLC